MRITLISDPENLTSSPVTLGILFQRGEGAIVPALQNIQGQKLCSANRLEEKRTFQILGAPLNKVFARK